MKRWFLLCYDIRNPKRLQRFHYRLSKEALALQQSVFLVRGDRAKIGRIEGLVKRYTHDREDDVRLYPIRNPGAVWTAGIQDQAFKSLYGGAPAPKRGLGVLARISRGLSRNNPFRSNAG